MIQAALHADEVPALLVAQALRTQLTALEAQGAVLGEVVLVPYANPIGLAQQLLGQHEGRFDLRDGLPGISGVAQHARIIIGIPDDRAFEAQNHLVSLIREQRVWRQWTKQNQK